MIYALCIILFGVGLYSLIVKRNIIKIILGLIIMENAINLLFILIGYRYNGRTPILEHFQEIRDMVDPLPQALVLTSIVISLATLALLVAIAIRIYEKYGTFDIAQIKKLKG